MVAERQEARPQIREITTPRVPVLESGNIAPSLSSNESPSSTTFSLFPDGRATEAVRPIEPLREGISELVVFPQDLDPTPSIFDDKATKDFDYESMDDRRMSGGGNERKFQDKTINIILAHAPGEGDDIRRIVESRVVDRNMSDRQAAQELGVSTSTVRDLKIYFGIPSRTRTGRNKLVSIR